MTEFKKGDKVFLIGQSTLVQTITERNDPDYPLFADFCKLSKDGKSDKSIRPIAVHATVENWLMLCQLFPDVPFENPRDLPDV